jgi:hypothetical protein
MVHAGCTRISTPCRRGREQGEAQCMTPASQHRNAPMLAPLALPPPLFICCSQRNGTSAEPRIQPHELLSTQPRQGIHHGGCKELLSQRGLQKAAVQLMHPRRGRCEPSNWVPYAPDLTPCYADDPMPRNRPCRKICGSSRQLWPRCSARTAVPRTRRPSGQ